MLTLLRTPSDSFGGAGVDRFYSSYSITSAEPSDPAIFSGLNPFFITGLTDAEGSFVCIIRKSAGRRLGWRV